MSDKTKILVVDDEPVMRQLLEAILVPEGYDILFGNDGEEALKVALNDLPDIILLDVMMPKMDGFEVCKRIRKHESTAHIAIFLITALDDRDSRIRGIDAGADDYISKPFDRIEILAKLKNKASHIHLLNKRSGVTATAEDSANKYDDSLIETLIKILHPKISENQDIMSYQSADIVKSQHSLFVEEAHHGKYIGLISNRLPVKNSALANSIFRQLLHEDIYKKDVEPDELLTRCNSELTKIRPVAAGKTLNSTDFSVALLYHKTHTNELVISGQNQHIFIFQQPNNETGSNENHYQVISLREIAKLTYQSPGIIYLFSTNILEKIEHSDVISFLNINLVNPTRTIFQDKIKEYYKQFDDFIVAHFKY